MLLLTGWIGDGAAYYVGKNFGRHKAMPNVSPNKVFPSSLLKTVPVAHLSVCCSLGKGSLLRSFSLSCFATDSSRCSSRE